MPEDLTKFGLIPEFIGRVPVTVSLDFLDEKALERILTEPKNALIKQYKKLFELDGVELKFTDEAINTIAKKAVERKQVPEVLEPYLKMQLWILCTKHLQMKQLRNVLLMKMLLTDLQILN